MGASSLDHEILDDSVEVESVIEPILYQFEEVPRGLWAFFGEEFDIYRSCACRHSNCGRHGLSEW